MTVNNLSRRRFLTIGGMGVLSALNYRQAIGALRHPQTLYVGTYTSGKSEGIYLYHMDIATGELKRINAFRSTNPSFLTIDKSKRYLYAVNEVNDFGEKPSGAVSVFEIERSSGNLKPLNQAATLGPDPCYVAVDRKGTWLLVANYSGGSVAVLSIQHDGQLGSGSQLAQHEGSGPKEQQKGPHAHCIVLDRHERHALSADLGTDKVMIYRFNRTTGKLIAANQPWISLQPGAGPRHLTFHPNGKFVYVINELDSTLSALKYDELKGTLSLIETVSTLPNDFTGVSYCADIHISSNGKFLYGSNRGHNSIAAFAVDGRSGRIKPLEHVSTEGKWPRNFTIDPTGRFLLVANQQTDSVVTFKIDSRSGRLQPTGHVAEIPAPVCLRFV